MIGDKVTCLAPISKVGIADFTAFAELFVFLIGELVKEKLLRACPKTKLQALAACLLHENRQVLGHAVSFLEYEMNFAKSFVCEVKKLFSPGKIQLGTALCMRTM